MSNQMNTRINLFEMSLSGAMSDPLSDPRQRPMDSAECRIKISGHILQVAEFNAE